MDFLGVDLNQLLANTGAIIAFLVIFAESSLVFFLPGDSFILVAGILASQGVLNLWELMGLMLLGAVLGNNFGYYLGKRFGMRFFKKEAKLFSHENLAKTEAFYHKHGPITIILARFTPIVRTIAPILAGVAKMNYRKFFFYNIAGAIIWVAGLGLLGYYAGSRIPNIDKYILPIIGIIVIASVLPGLVQIFWPNKKR